MFDRMDFQKSSSCMPRSGVATRITSKKCVINDIELGLVEL
jgi:hypothetical protein